MNREEYLRSVNKDSTGQEQNILLADRKESLSSVKSNNKCQNQISVPTMEIKWKGSLVKGKNKFIIGNIIVKPFSQCSDSLPLQVSIPFSLTNELINLYNLIHYSINPYSLSIRSNSFSFQIFNKNESLWMKNFIPLSFIMDIIENLQASIFFFESCGEEIPNLNAEKNFMEWNDMASYRSFSYFTLVSKFKLF